MSITKADLRTRVQQIADAVADSRWDATPGGEIDQHIGVVMDREWKRILSTNPYYRIGRRSVTSDTSGYYTLTDLDTGSADSAQRHYRVLAVSVDSIIYEESRLDEWLLPDTTSPMPQYIWYFEGTKLMALPIQVSKAAIIVVNWIPPRQEQLAGESSVVDFPDGYENVVAWSAAGMLLNKGASEAARAQVLEFQAEALRMDMLQDIQRRSTAPTRMRYSDASSDYAG